MVVISESNKWFTDCIDQEMLNFTLMKVTNKKKGIFSFYSHNMNKKINERHFNYSGLNVSIESVNNQ